MKNYLDRSWRKKVGTTVLAAGAGLLLAAAALIVGITFERAMRRAADDAAAKLYRSLTTAQPGQPYSQGRGKQWI